MLLLLPDGTGIAVGVVSGGLQRLMLAEGVLVIEIGGGQMVFVVRLVVDCGIRLFLFGGIFHVSLSVAFGVRGVTDVFQGKGGIVLVRKDAVSPQCCVVAVGAIELLSGEFAPDVPRLAFRILIALGIGEVETLEIQV